jgi:hypothetical protein
MPEALLLQSIRDNAVEPPVGIEPMTYALRVASWRSAE